MVETLKIEDLLPSYRTHQKAKRCADRTVELSKDYVARLAVWLVGEGRSTKVGDIDNRVLEQYLVHLADSLSDTTVAMHYRTVRAFFGWLHREDEIDVNPFDKMVQPKVSDKPPEVLTYAQVVALLNATKDSRAFESRRDCAIFMTFIDTGVRLGELTSMRVDWFDDDNRLATVGPKGGGTRQVQFGLKAWEAIDRYRRVRLAHPHADRPDFWLAPKGALSKSGVAQMIKRRCIDADIEHIHPHQFRHTFVHLLLRQGKQHALPQLMGWTSAQMVEVYGRSAAYQRAMEAKSEYSPGDHLWD